MKKFLIAVLAVLMVAMPIPASALTVYSPTHSDQPSLTVESSNPNAGTVTQTQVKGNTHRATATPAPGYTFDRWVIESDGPYTIVEGDLNSPDIVIQSDYNVRMIAYFNATSGIPGSTSPTSPSTGDHFGLIVLATTIALVGAAYACKKIFA